MNFILLFTLTLYAFSAWFFRQHMRWRRPSVESKEPAVTVDYGRWLGWSFAAGALLILVVAFASFRFLHDDFHNLLAYEFERPVDNSIRLISIDLVFSAGAALGGPRCFFATVNAVVALMGFAFLQGTIRHVTGSRATGLVCAGAFALTPGWLSLLRWGVGVQWLLVISLLFGVLWCISRAATSRSSTPFLQWSLYFLSLAFITTAVLSKFAVAIVIPVSAWLWGKYVVTSRPGPFALHRAYLAYPAMFWVLALGKLVGPPGSDLERVGLAKITENIGHIWSFSKSGGAYALFVISGLLLYKVIRAACCAEPSVGAPKADALHRLHAGIIAALRGLRDALLAPVGKVPAVLVVIVGVLVSVPPVLFNQQYFARYYLVIFVAWPCLLFATVLVRLVHRDPLTPLIAILCVIFLFPYEAVKQSFAVNSANTVDTWAKEIALSASPEMEACSVVLRNGCLSMAEQERTDELLDDYWRYSEEGLGLVWRMSPPRRDVFFLRDGQLHTLSGSPEPCAPCVELSYCEDTPARIEWRPGGEACQ